MEFAYDIFLSYSRRDAGIAKHFASELQGAGLKCFLAERDVAAGERWEERIRDALLNSERIVLLITPRAKRSLWVAAEAGAAWVLKKELVAALMFVEPEELIDPIKKHQARPAETPEQMKALVNELSKEDRQAREAIAGQWVDPSDGDVAFFKQKGDRVVGFYDLGTGERKVGVYLGRLQGETLEYSWEWLNGQFKGHGRMIISEDRKRLTGEWWPGKKTSETERIQYSRVSDEMPGWLDDRDFDQYKGFWHG